MMRYLSLLSLLSVASSCSIHWKPAGERPDLASRCFTSSAVDAAIEDLSSKMPDTKLAKLFTNCAPNTLDTTLFVNVSSDSEGRSEVRESKLLR
jgi:hypothetical protein